jgi:hypothetical protein
LSEYLLPAAYPSALKRVVTVVVEVMGVAVAAFMDVVVKGLVRTMICVDKHERA